MQEDLHPPVREKVGQYAYLAGIGVLALAFGASLTAVSRMDFAERGISGTLAWTQSAGMPMRPAMSVMRTAEDLTRGHEAWMHLIASRTDLATFSHVHPEPTLNHPS